MGGPSISESLSVLNRRSRNFQHYLSFLNRQALVLNHNNCLAVAEERKERWARRACWPKFLDRAPLMPPTISKEDGGIVLQDQGSSLALEGPPVGSQLQTH